MKYYVELNFINITNYLIKTSALGLYISFIAET